MNFRGFVLRAVDNLFRHKVLYILPVLLFGALGIYMASGVEQYSSRGVVFVQNGSFLSSLTEVRVDGFSYSYPSDLATTELYGLLETESFVKSVLDLSGAKAKMSYPGQPDAEIYEVVRSSIEAVPGGENFVTIAAYSDQPDVARNLSAATIETFIQWQIDADLAQSRSAEQFVEELIVGYRADADVARQNLGDWVRANPGPNIVTDRPIDEQIALRSLEEEITNAEARYSLAVSKGEEARLATAQAESSTRQGFAIVDAPALPEVPENGLMDLLISGVFFGVLGAAMSAAVLAFTSASDTTLRFPSEVEELLGVDLLAVVPKVSPS